MKKGSRILCALLLLALVFITNPPRALAASGAGTAANPYVVTTYNELRSRMANTEGTYYIRLGADLVSNDSTAQNNLSVSGSGIVCNLDLAGHTVTRKTTSSDQIMVSISSEAALIISDSVGGGGMTANLSCGTAQGCLLYVSGGGKLTVNGGTFVTTNGKCVLSQGGPITIHGGYFKGTNYALERDYGGDLTVTGGTFEVTGNYGTGIYFAESGASTSITSCTVLTPGSANNKAVFVYRSASEKLADYIPVRAAITVDGSSFTMGSTNVIKGKKTVITSKKISSVSITGLDEPVVGQHPDTTMTIVNADGIALTGTATWYCSGTWGGTAMTEADVFDLEHDYACSIKIYAAENGTWFPISPERDAAGFYDVYDGVLTVNGEAIEGHVADSNGTLKLNWWKGKYAKAECPFVDVPEGEYYYKPVVWAAANGIVYGTDDTHFSPDATCNRAQVVTFLYRAAGEPTVTGKNPFADVKAGEYYYDAVLWGYQNGIVYGTDDTHFSPNAQVTRAQFITFLHRFAKEPAATITTSPFTDVPAGAYYTDAVLWGYENEIVYGTDEDKFSPDASCTRGQVVTFLYRYLTK